MKLLFAVLCLTAGCSSSAGTTATHGGSDVESIMCSVLLGPLDAAVPDAGQINVCRGTVCYQFGDGGRWDCCVGHPGTSCL